MPLSLELWEQIANNNSWEGAEGEFGRRQAAGEFTAQDVVDVQHQVFGPRYERKAFMHPTDHQAALRVVLGREPTYFEVMSSWTSGSANIDAAWKINTFAPDEAPKTDLWRGANQPTRKQWALRSRGISLPTALRIVEGRQRDPKPTATANTLQRWKGIIRRRAPGT